MQSKASNIATGGILIALTVVILYLTPLIPINTLGLLTITSLFVPIGLMRCNMKTSIAIYIGSSILSFLLVPLNISFLYLIFFGIYGIIKHLAEKRNNRIKEFIIKLLFFNIGLIIYYVIFTSFIGVLNLKISIYLLYVVSQIVFLIYDFALTLLIAFYLDKLHNR